jgi:F-type H+-transporting ATPase subunit epsilon
MAEKLGLRVVTPEQPIFEGEVDSVVVPAHDGEVGILPRHARMLASLGVGELRATTGGRVERFFVEGGFVQVGDNRVTVLCDHASRLEVLDPAAAEAQAAAARAARSPDAAWLQQRAASMRRVASHSPASPAPSRAGH